ncbi:MAG: nucleotide exchange factor GrpE [Patescibacteria group bacterium]|nr:nucleotide exchange factor GrpE [Patescibacteria group bacterium]
MHHTKKEDSHRAELQAKADEYLAGWKRSQADYQNLEREYSQRMASIAEYSAADVIAKFMPVIDNFELALLHMPKEIKDLEWASGLFQVQKDRDALLQTLNIERIISVGQKFDPHMHEAVGYEPSEKVAEGSIIKEVQIGYKMKDRLIRPARVIVSKGKHH